MAPRNHYFYALALPESVKTKLHEISQQWQGTLPFKTWVHHQDLHITLAFLGAAPEEKLEHTIHKMQSEFICPAFSLSINHLGVFGKKDAPRIFWAGVNDEPGLKQARELVYHACLSAGFSLETRPFHPHITIARKWVGNEPFSREILKEQNPFNEAPLTFQAEKVVLYETHLGNTPKYKQVTSFILEHSE